MRVIMIVLNRFPKSLYLYYAYIHTGKITDWITLDLAQRMFATPTQAVLRLSKPIQWTNQNVTEDNGFRSKELIELLKTRGITYVGTI